MPDRQLADTDHKSRQDESSLCETKINIENVRNFAHFIPVTLELDLDIVARSRSQSFVSAPIPEIGVETFGQGELWNPLKHLQTSDDFVEHPWHGRHDC